MNDQILNKIDDQLLTYTKIISKQREEILKSEKLIDQFKNHLLKQNDALQTFKKEAEKLIEVRNLKNNQLAEETDENTVDLDDEVLQCSEDNTTGKSVTERNNIPLSKSLPYFKKNQIKILEIRNKVVYRILEYNGYYVIGGSKGLLMRCEEETTHIFETSTKEDIMQVEIVIKDVKTSLLAFTKETLMIFEDIENISVRRDVPLSCMGYVYNDGQWIYVPLKKGKIIRISNQDLSLEDFLDLKKYIPESFIPGRSNNSPSLFCCADDSLYKIINKPVFKILDLDLFSNIVRVFRILTDYFLFYRTDRIYIVSPNLVNCGTLTFDNGIKFVDVYCDFIAVVDSGDILYIYKVTRLGSIHGKVLTERLKGKITALSLTEEALVCIGNDIFKIIYKI